MDKKTKVILLCGLFALLLVGAAFAYQKLSKDYKAEEPQTSTSDAAADNSSEAPAAKPTVTPIPVPDFLLSDASGNELNFSEFKGKPTIVNFWTPWCPYCQSEMPYFQEIYDTYKDTVNVVMLDVPDSRNSAEDAIQLIAEAGYRFPLYLDTHQEATITFGVYSYPQTFFFDSNGDFVGRISGAVPSSERLTEIVEKLIQLPAGEMLQ